MFCSVWARKNKMGVSNNYEVVVCKGDSSKKIFDL